jgi:glyceraldehyde 3-phosphate dehydrogenase
MTTVHATTSTQMTTDGPSRKTGEVDCFCQYNSIFYRCCKAVGKVIPELNGNLLVWLFVFLLLMFL